MKQLAIVLVFICLSCAKTNSQQGTTPTGTSSEVLICDSETAGKYHEYECRGLSNCTHPILNVSKEEAVERGYGACGICY